MRALLLALVALSACATAPPEPKVVTQTVTLAAPVSCIPKDMSPRPTYADDDAALKAAPDFSVRYLLFAEEHAHHFATEDMLWGIIDACRKAAP